MQNKKTAIKRKNIWRKENTRNFIAELKEQERDELISYLRKKGISNVDFVKNSFRNLKIEGQTYIYQNKEYNLKDMIEQLENQGIIQKK